MRHLKQALPVISVKECNKPPNRKVQPPVG